MEKSQKLTIKELIKKDIQDFETMQIKASGAVEALKVLELQIEKQENDDRQKKKEEEATENGE